MKVKVISIELAPELGKFNVLGSIGSECHQWTMTVETETIADRQIQVIKGDKHFCNTFRFNQKIAIELYHILSKFNKGQPVELPVEIGEFSQVEVERVSFQKAVTSTTS
ncbi:MAG: hypothetical protein EBE86_005415 [Hormoscilla sp. GUM202]|nr:hypothetical protein [Hormoscilla sp. GUM202]